MSQTLSLHELPYGLVELDNTGTVLYFNPEKRDGATPPLIGRNFFTDIKPIAEDATFQRHIKNFRQSSSPSQSFSFTFNFEDQLQHVRVLLARIHEQTPDGGRDSVFVHIRKHSLRERPAAAV